MLRASGAVTIGRSAGRLDVLLSQSRGLNGRAHLSRETRQWLGGLEPLLPPRFRVHEDGPAREATRLLGVGGFVHRDRIVLGDTGSRREAILRHELAHLAQVELALRTGTFSPSATVEQEADAISRLPVAPAIRHGADPDALHPFVWFIAAGAGLYVLLRPGVANAPGPGDTVQPSPSAGQILGEAICLFAIPGGAMRLGGRLGLGFLGSSALAGAGADTGLRAVSDLARGEASPPLMYLFDAGTGAVLGFVIPGGFRLVGRAGTFAFDRLATYGMSRSDIGLTRLIAERAAEMPVTATELQSFLQSRGLAGQVSQWWLNRRGLIVLYRGQSSATPQILSPAAREQGVAGSEALLARIRSFGETDDAIAAHMARYNAEPLRQGPPAGLVGVPVGAVGIPTTSIPGIAAGPSFGGRSGVIYIIHTPRISATRALGWAPLGIENEYMILHQIPRGSILQAIPSNRVTPLSVDELGRLIPRN